MTAQVKGGHDTFAIFDAFRFIAAVVVVLEHARNMLMMDYDPAKAILATKAFYFVTRFGHQAVIVFFVMSGFWIASVLDRRSSSPAFWPNYLVDRLVRLLLVLVPALLIGGVLDSIGIWLLHGPIYEGSLGTEAITSRIAPALGPEVFVGNVLFLQRVLVPTFGSNGALWSLANEFWYYMWFAALFLLIRQGKATWGLASLGIAIVAPRLLELFPIWLMGAALYFLYQGTGFRFAASRRAGAMISYGIACIFVLALILTRFALVPLPVADAIVALSFTALLWILLELQTALPTCLKPLAKWGAGSSFTLYACHDPILAMATTLLNGSVRMGPGAGAVTITLLVTAFCAVWSHALARLTEAHTTSVRHWIRRKLNLRNVAGHASRDPHGSADETLPDDSTGATER